MPGSGCAHILHNARTIVFAICLAAVCACCSADTPQPVVAVDEFHFNALLLNSGAIWRMTTLADELVAGGYSVVEIDGPITPAILSGCSVLLVTTPSVDYDDTEIDAIAGFASAGGGVLFCANYGVKVWSPICQSFTNTFGITLDNNSAKDTTHNASGNDRWITFGGSCLASHPLTGGVASLQCYSTTTIAPAGVATAIATTDSDAVPASKPAILARSYGAGRVVVTGNPMYFADRVPDVDIGGGNKADMNGLLAADNRRFAYNAITWLAGTAARPLVTASLSKSVVVPGDIIEVDGTVCDATLAGYVLEYRLAGGIGAWTQIDAAHSTCVIQGRLGEWSLAGVSPGDYTLRVTANNTAGGSYSVSDTVHVAQILSRLSDIASTPEGAYVRLVDKEVVAGSDDLVGRIYLEESDRTRGLCVVTSAAALRGTLATVTGIHSASAGTHTVTAVDVTTRPRPSGDPLGPVGVVNGKVGGSSAGANTTGLLVKTWGTVLGSDSDGITITDGSSGTLKVLTGYARGPISAPDDGSTVAVVGAGATFAGGPAVVARQSLQVIATP